MPARYDAGTSDQLVPEPRPVYLMGRGFRARKPSRCPVLRWTMAPPPRVRISARGRIAVLSHAHECAIDAIANYYADNIHTPMQRWQTKALARYLATTAATRRVTLTMPRRKP